MAKKTGLDIGALVARLVLDDSQFKDGVERNEKELARIQRRMKAVAGAVNGVIKGFKAAAVAAGVYAGAMAAVVLRTSAAIDQMTKLAAKVGLTTEELSKLNYAAGLSNVELTQLQGALIGLSERVLDALKNKTGDAAIAFKALNIDLKDTQGNVRSVDDLLYLVANRMSALEDGATKTAIATRLFGGAGAEIIPLLNEGAAGFALAAKEANEFGIVISEKAAKEAAIFNTNIGRIQGALSGMATKITEAVTPALIEMTDDIIKWVKETRAIERAAELAVRGLDLLRSIFGLVKVGIELAAGAVHRFLTALGDLVEFIATLDLKSFDDTLNLIKNDLDALSGAAERSGQAIIDASSRWQIGAKGMVDGAQEPLNTLGSMLAGISDSAAKLQLPEDVAKSFANAAALTTPWLTETNNLLAKEQALLYGLQTPMEEYAAILKRVKDLQDQNGISADNAYRIQSAAASQLASDYLGMAGQIGGALSSIFNENKGIAIATAIINTAQAVTKALATYGPTPWGFAAAATAAASGAAQIAQIRRQTATGGSGGTVSPGASTGAGGGFGGGPQQVIQIRGLDPASIFTGGMVDELVSQINKYVQNGGTVLSTTTLGRATA